MAIIKVTVMFMVMITDTVMITDHGINNLVVSVRILFLQTAETVLRKRINKKYCLLMRR